MLETMLPALRSRPPLTNPQVPARACDRWQLSVLRRTGERASTFRTALGLFASHSNRTLAPLLLTDRIVKRLAALAKSRRLWEREATTWGDTSSALGVVIGREVLYNWP